MLVAFCSFNAYANMNSYTIDPAPGAVQEISSVKFTFEMEMLTNVKVDKFTEVFITNKDNPTQQYGVLSVSYGGFGDPSVTLKFCVPGTTDAVVITDDGTWNLVIPAGVLKGLDSNWIEELGPEIDVEWIIGGEPENDMSRYVLDPPSGEISKLSSIKVSFPDTDWNGIADPKDNLSGITLTKEGYPTKVYTVIKYDYTFGNDATLYFDLADAEVKNAMDIVEAGTYSLKIPAQTFKKGYTSEEIYNSEISATYTIPSVAGQYMSGYSVTPAAGKVEKISTITFTFGGVSGQCFVVDGADLSTIKLHRKGESYEQKDYICLEAQWNNKNAFTLSFAEEGGSTPVEIVNSGEYMLTVPAGMFYQPLDLVDWKNDAITLLYHIEKPTSTTSLENYEIVPADGEELASFSGVTITFPDTNEGLQYPFGEMENVNLTVRSYVDGSETVYGETGREYSLTEPNKVGILFAQPLEPLTTPGEYTVNIPSGTFFEAGNPNATNVDIVATYTIPAVPAESIVLDMLEKTEDKDAVFVLTATVLPENTTNKTVEWSSTNTEVATVDETGKVTCVNYGTCKILATTTDGTALSAECSLKVASSLGIAAVNADDNDLYEVYSTTGVLLMKNATASELGTLAAGIYIVNGRKYVVK